MSINEFLKRWKEGIDKITPYQQVRGQLISSIPIFVGLIFGIIVTINSKTWWILLILIGSLGLVFFQTIGTIQKFIRLRIQEMLLKSINSQQDGSNSNAEQVEFSDNSTSFQASPADIQ